MEYLVASSRTKSPIAKALSVMARHSLWVAPMNNEGNLVKNISAVAFTWELKDRLHLSRLVILVYT